MKFSALRVSLLMLFLQCALSAPAFAQARVSVGGVELDSEAGVSGVLGDVDDNLEETVDEDGEGKQRSWEPVVAPLTQDVERFRGHAGG